LCAEEFISSVLRLTQAHRSSFRAVWGCLCCAVQ